MKKKRKITFKEVTRQDISNPFHKNTHEENLKLGNVKVFSEFDVINLPGGRIQVVPKFDETPNPND